MLRRILTLGICSFFAISGLTAQDIGYAWQVMNSLTDSSFHGRGYVNKGDSIAAEYIAMQFNKLNLQHFRDDYFQEFKININTFPGKMALAVNGKPLTPGVDFLVHPCSPAIDGKFKTYTIEDDDTEDIDKLVKLISSPKNKYSIAMVDATTFDDEDEKKVLQLTLNTLLNAEGSLSAASVKVVDEKLTWFMSKEVCLRPQFFVKKESLPKKVKNISFKVEQQLKENYTTRNVIGYIEGNKYPDSFVVFTAHYDHLGRMGEDIYFPGANDDASGVAMIINLAKYFSDPANRLDYSVAFIAFSAEEVGLLGSEYYVKNPLFPVENIKFLINMDMVGTGDKGITVVNATEFEDEFDRLKQINKEKDYLVEIKSRGKAMNSDHYYFTEAGAPAFFIYTQGGPPHYHDVSDKLITLPLDEFEDLFRLIVDFTEGL